MKKYKLDVKHVGEEELILMSKGHHDPHEFMRAAFALLGDDRYELMPPSREWTRAMPSNEYACVYVAAEPHSRGAFPTTYTREAFVGESYKSEETHK